jgi:serine/threonine protein kinase
MEERLIGMQLGGYIIGKHIGDGGMGSVYQASKPGMTEPLAIKVLLPEYASDEEFRIRFVREAAVLRQLQHPNIMPVYDFGEDAGYVYFVMRLIRGISLFDLALKRRFSPLAAWQILDPIAQALDYAYARGVIHRDIKPANILIEVQPSESGPRNHVFLADFGLSKVMTWAALTKTGISVGTPQYMSPEQVMDEELTAASDVYALGIVVYELLLGRWPFYDKRPERIAFKQVEAKPPRPRDLNINFPLPLEAVILRALEKSPEKRFKAAGDFRLAYAEAVKRIDPAHRKDEYWVGPPAQP